MKSRSRVGSLMVFGLAMALNANASEMDCFPMCPEHKVEVSAAVPIEGGPGEMTGKSCDDGLVKQVEALNDKVKPIREIVGYVRSPQGLAIKLVNDYIVSIPAWIGFAMDPVGSLKHMAIDEVRTRAKAAIVSSSGSACENATVIVPVEGKETRDTTQSI